jgi:hypothetical protein
MFPLLVYPVNDLVVDAFFSLSDKLAKDTYRSILRRSGLQE